MRVRQVNRTPWNTGIDVNTKDTSTHAYIYLASRHWDAGDATDYEFGVIRLGYSGDHATQYKIAGIDVIEISVDGSKLVITPITDGTKTFITLIQ